MKIRNGFVSNSSSSSFIIGIGEITDLKEFTKWNKNSNAEVLKSKDIVDSEYFDGESMYIDSFLGNGVSIPFKYNTDYIIFYTSGPEDDLWNEEWEGYNYDIDLSHFYSEDIGFVKEVEKHGVTNFSIEYGAGRDG